MLQFNNKKYLISPSILAADFSDLENEFAKMKRAGIEYIHYDVMDNHFVPQLTFGYKFVSDFNKKTDLLSDVHLMIENPDECVDKYINAESDLITFHVESMKRDNALKAIEQVKNAGKDVGLSIKPKTKISELEPFLDLIDMVLVMTVEPGFAGQQLITECLPKISNLRETFEKKNLNIVIQADGGIKLTNIKELFQRGCTFFVMGSAFFKAVDYNVLISEIDEILL